MADLERAEQRRRALRCVDDHATTNAGAHPEVEDAAAAARGDLGQITLGGPPNGTPPNSSPIARDVQPHPLRTVGQAETTPSGPTVAGRATPTERSLAGSRGASHAISRERVGGAVPDLVEQAGGLDADRFGRHGDLPHPAVADQGGAGPLHAIGAESEGAAQRCLVGDLR